MPRFHVWSTATPGKEFLMMRRCLLLILLATLGLTGTSAPALARPCLPPDCGAPSPPSASSVVSTYFGVLNQGMTSGDFSALAEVYSPDATVIRNNPDGHSTTIHGLAAITRFYQQTRTGLVDARWVHEGLRTLSGSIVLSYEHTSSGGLTTPARSSHLFVIKDGLIRTVDWTVYYSGRR